MRILVALIAVFMVSGAVAQLPPRHPGFEGGGVVTCDVHNVRGAPSWSCKDPKTGKTQMVKCKKPPKEKLPPKLSMAELNEACGIVIRENAN